jgi:hypothetical protein
MSRISASSGHDSSHVKFHLIEDDEGQQMCPPRQVAFGTFDELSKHISTIAQHTQTITAAYEVPSSDCKLQYA